MGAMQHPWLLCSLWSPNIVVAGAPKAAEPTCLWARRGYGINARGATLAAGRRLCEAPTHYVGLGRINGSYV